MVIAYAAILDLWVPIPVRCTHFKLNVPPPISAIVKMLYCHYPQGDNDLCLFYSFASTLFHLGFDKDSKQVQTAGHNFENYDHNSQIEGLPTVVASLNIFDSYYLIVFLSRR
jgi:hypothetical protein